MFFFALPTDGFGGTDTVIDVESVSGGTNDDQIIGSAEINNILGNAGAEALDALDAIAASEAAKRAKQKIA